jgi:outer membrane protein
MKQHNIVFALAVVLLAAAASPALSQQASAPAGYKIGYVDTERVMRTSRAARKVQKELEDEFSKRAKEIESGPPADAARRQGLLAEEMGAKREYALKEFTDKANVLLRRIAEAEKYDAVFFEAAYASPRIDLTDRVVKALDAER